MIDVHDDLHLAVEFLNRAAVMRDEIGVTAYRRAMHRALVALGDAVIDEAERMAGASARAPSGTVVPFGRTSRAIRRSGDAADPEGSKRRAGRADPSTGPAR
ncbi:hypothetical protein PUR23_14360 [Methylorubrum populi]|jgi:hypothetical protein|uniref:Uncharacterized protein n=1 Tax=Methylobacterium brachiatum TaxID=269660 RepID=A0AAJ1WUA3_9HYPH|nr:MULTISPECIES: hypothetical protein [Methylobacterium]MCB4802812.1 hypothetical protein [Methylobacterium brachiatum]MDQ0543449.1 hypothetical protein [Methylobacterium brachiatum]